MKNCIRVALLAIITVNSLPTFSQDIYYTVASSDNFLRKIDLTLGTVLDSVQLTMAGDSVIRAQGLAKDPGNGDVYAIITSVNQTTRSLVTLDTLTGIATYIGNTGDQFSAITFDESANLFGVTGDGATQSEILYRIAKTTAITTNVLALGNGDDGEALAFNTDNNTFYHASGLGDPGVSKFFESISGTVVTDIPTSGMPYEEVTALVYTGNNEFVAACWNRYYTFNTAGVVTAMDTLNFGWFNCKGLMQSSSSTNNLSNISPGKELTIYPNPTSGILYISQKQFLGAPFEIFDNSGKRVMSGELKEQLDISSLNPGFYHLKVHYASNLYDIELVKQ